MSGDPAGRRLLPQNPPMQSYAFAPNDFGQRENQKNYVFVDEHNRHKRLKVMRACEGCRRRKIKCDAATTNTWPCSACIRLKLHCVPPTVNYDPNFPGGAQGYEHEREEYGTDGNDGYHQQMALQPQQMTSQPKAIPPIYTQQLPQQGPVGVYHQSPYGEQSSGYSQQPMHYGSLQTPVSVMDPHQQYPPQSAYTTPILGHQSHSQSPQSSESYDQDQYGQQNLADLLGNLRVNADGSAPYIDHKNQMKNKALAGEPEEPAFEDVDDYKSTLPASSSGPGMKIRIPPELMPDDETAMSYFDLFFSNVHPYVPVVNKSSFYQQWHTNRDAISPLILEAIFAIAGKLADEPTQGHQWLSLTSKHADSFMDIPRLSTLQALLIILKAREASPKKGYYYRSWMTVVHCVQMAKGLGLDDHYEEHKAGKSCGSDLADCITKTRIWQLIFVCEVMVGSPQGRLDMGVPMDTLDLSVVRPSPSVDDSEYHTTRKFTYFTRVVQNVRRMTNVYARIKNRKDWGLDPELVQLNPLFDAWLNDLPGDLQVTFPADGAPPWLPSHYIGNLHAYYHLAIIMLHRPQLTFMEPTGADGGWKHHMMICYSSAKLLCRLQESILQSFGMTGLLSMQRGINFTIYCVLTCTVLHLVALTSPDPDLNHDAREFFTRHMRILEKCSSSWPMPDMQHQVDALREAFSADTRKPFVLKPSFPYHSPGPAHLRPQGYNQPSSGGQRTLEHHAQPSHVSYTNIPISPPISAGGMDTKSDSPALQSLAMIAASQRAPQQSMPSGVPMTDSTGWDPAAIFDRWNTTFGTPAHSGSSAIPQSISPLKQPVPGAQEIPTLSANSGLPNVNLTSGSHPMPPQQYSGAAIPSFISPSMWQESVQSVYEGGLKRQWNYDEEDGSISNVKRPR
ncbi:hypothetical protein BJ878DRAFT_418599 [Calycina marina]|uniref:Zn(2)-C6 fungal-type domain-containing protein n=1 Tax=Calycina marina TaxID=1763456 RepID=A0A9P7Z6F6_9HELO|nr:hypothetical protein BJ878DRAFT_418599 [Calycina marina]